MIASNKYKSLHVKVGHKICVCVLLINKHIIYKHRVKEIISLACGLLCIVVRNQRKCQTQLLTEAQLLDQDIDKNVLAVAKEIQSYLDKHPNAADSAEGVMRWWLSQQRFEESMQIVQAALELLVSKGNVDRAVTPGGRAVYSNTRLTSKDKSH